MNADLQAAKKWFLEVPLSLVWVLRDRSEPLHFLLLSSRLAQTLRRPSFPCPILNGTSFSSLLLRN